MLRVIDVLRVLDPSLECATMKIHLATTGSSNPLDEYLAGTFAQWQRSQSRRNFELRHVLSLIALPAKDQWLFAGAYVSEGCVPDAAGGYHYALTELASCSELGGRLIATFRRPGRQAYLNAAGYAGEILLAQILPERMTIAQFPGYKTVDISRMQLRVIVEQNLESWRAALSSVAGVYLISDAVSGGLYVGSATGEGGIWQRWAQYNADGHGGNVALKALLDEHGAARGEAFRYSVLEIADTHASVEEIRLREIHWKNVLLTRFHGLNANL